MSYEEEDTCHCQRHGISTIIRRLGNEEEDTCHMRRRIRVIVSAMVYLLL
jgi:hypothetical protein